MSSKKGRGAIKVIMTSAGSQVAPSLAGMIKRNTSYEVSVIGVDAGIKARLVGRYFCDRFYKVPFSCEEGYIPAMLKICRAEGASVIFPGSDEEAERLARSRDKFLSAGAKIACAEPSVIERCCDKLNLMDYLGKKGISLGRFYRVRDIYGLIESCARLGYPERNVVIKPRTARGSRGFRIITKGLNLYDKFSKNNFYMTTLDEILNVFRENPSKIENFFLMEYFAPPRYSVDILMKRKRPAISVCRKKLSPINSPTQLADIVYDRDVIQYAEGIAGLLKFDYFVQVEVGRDEDNRPSLIEINPRIDATLPIIEGLGLNYFEYMIDYALHGDFNERPPVSQKRGLRFYRYWQHLFAKV